MAYVKDFPIWFGAVALAASSVLTSTAIAQDTSSLVVQANVNGSCTISGNGESVMDFGAFDGIATDATATIGFTCTAESDVLLGLDNGGNQSDGNRFMRNGDLGLMQYGLFQDSDRLIPWGNDLSSGVQVADTTGDEVTVFGRIPTQNVPAPGSYTDNVLITLTTN